MIETSGLLSHHLQELTLDACSRFTVSGQESSLSLRPLSGLSRCRRAPSAASGVSNVGCRTASPAPESATIQRRAIHFCGIAGDFHALGGSQQVRVSLSRRSSIAAVRRDAHDEFDLFSFFHPLHPCLLFAVLCWQATDR